MGLADRWQVRKLRRGDPDACRRLVADHAAKVFAYLSWLGADRELAEDLTQETYAKAWGAIGELRQVGALRPWLLRIARNEYFQARRHPRLELLEDEAGQAVADGAPRHL